VCTEVYYLTWQHFIGSSGGAKTSRQPFPGQYVRKAGHSRLTFCSK